MLDLNRPMRIHLIGAGGAGMSALAKLLSSKNHEVSGSDIRMAPIMANLADLGVDVWEGSRPGAIQECELVVASSAVPETDPEYRAALEAGITVWERPELLASITAQIPTIGATGTHGKTTSTALMIAAIRATGLDPSFLVGGELTDLRTNAHLGSDELLVLEADEAFSTFSHLSLKGLMVTNVEADHLDHYETLDRLEDAFAEVVRKVDGPVVVGVDDPGGRRLAERTSRPTYGTSSGADWKIANVSEKGTSVSFTLHGPTEQYDVEVGRPGLHVARNASGVLALLGELGHDIGEASQGLSTFAGVKRRLETRAKVAGVTIMDSYAHHPTEVAADLRAVANGGWRRIWVVFQPHLYSRTAALAGEFGGSFSGADHVVVTDVYGSREAPVPGVTGELVADAAQARSGADVHYVPRLGDVVEFLSGRVSAGDLILTLGAGDITMVPDEIAPRLAQRT